ncbi:GFA family protein [Candidatus Poribacteria bacterium]|nr:GFA family protein [Candidatus Poribacteria bacterium]
MPAENKAAAVVPLISSSIAGPLGVKHLPRLWNKVLLSAKGLLHEDYHPACGSEFDKRVLDALGLDGQETVDYLGKNLPTYPEFEKWVLQKNGGSLNPAAVERVNAAILAAPLREDDRKAVLFVVGLPDDSSIKDAVTLNNLVDWDEFHRNLVSGFEKNPEGTVITGGCHCGAVRYRVTNPKSWWSKVCHCYSCRLVGGAPYLPLIAFPGESFAWIYGEPKRYYYVRGFGETGVAWTERTSCGRCGTQLTHKNNDEPREEREKFVSVNIISLDDPNAFPPRDWSGAIGMKLSWVSIPPEAAAWLIRGLIREDYAYAHHIFVATLKQIGTPEAMKAVEEYEKRSQAAQSDVR